MLPACAFLTIGAAANVMVAGDAVWMGAGTFSEQVTCLNSGNTSSVISYPPPAPSSTMTAQATDKVSLTDRSDPS